MPVPPLLGGQRVRDGRLRLGHVEVHAFRRIARREAAGEEFGAHRTVDDEMTALRNQLIEHGGIGSRRHEV